jgi:hypothetical protein
MSLLDGFFAKVGKVEETTASLDDDGNVVKSSQESQSDSDKTFTDLIFGAFNFKDPTMKATQDEIAKIGRGRGVNPVNGNVMYDGLEYKQGVGWVQPEGGAESPPWTPETDCNGSIPYIW